MLENREDVCKYFNETLPTERRATISSGIIVSTFAMENFVKMMSHHSPTINYKMFFVFI